MTGESHMKLRESELRKDGKNMTKIFGSQMAIISPSLDKCPQILYNKQLNNVLGEALINIAYG